MSKVVREQAMLLAVTGQRSHGKTTISKYLQRRHGFLEVGIADPMKRAVQQAFQLTDDQLWGDSKEQVDEFWQVEPRKILQVFGTELMRKELSRHVPQIAEGTVWLRSFQKWYAQLRERSPQQHVVISDLRFPREWAFCQPLGCQLWYVERPDLVHEDQFQEHESEQGYSQLRDNATHIIINDGTSDQLYRKIDQLVEYKVQAN